MKLFTILSLTSILLSSALDYANSAPAVNKIPAWCNPTKGPMNGWLNFFKIRKWCKRNGYSEFGRYKALSFRHQPKDEEREENNEIEEDFCQDIFDKNPNVDCVLFDDERCDGDEGIKKLKSGDVVTNIEETLGFDIESVSIKKGCQLKMHTGEDLSAENFVIKAKLEDKHITFHEESEKSLQNFDDNVNSAICSCTADPLSIYQTTS